MILAPWADLIIIPSAQLGMMGALKESIKYQLDVSLVLTPVLEPVDRNYMFVHNCFLFSYYYSLYNSRYV